MLYQETFETDTREGISVKDITTGIQNAVRNAGFNSGICSIFITATTAGLFINEDERMLIEDIKKSFKAMADDSRIYQHPSNAPSHIRANYVDKDLAIPIKEGDLVLGTWQRIFLAEFDKIPRKRKIIITIVGE
jgi:secondary thiamine-phosphate synthase enzyme